MDLQIRDARADDVDALEIFAVETYREAFGYSLSASDLAAHVSMNLSRQRVESFVAEDLVLLAHAHADLLGFVQLGAPDAAFAPLPPGALEMRRLYVHGSHRGRGIGSALIAAALDHPSVAPDVDLYLDVWSRNEGAQRLYRRHGFEVCGVRRFEVASGAQTDVDFLMVRRAPASRRPSALAGNRSRPPPRE